MPSVTTADLEKRYIERLAAVGVSAERLADLEFDAESVIDRANALDLTSTMDFAFTLLEGGRTAGLMNPMWRALLADLIASIPVRNELRRPALYIGELPTAEFNAHLDRSFSPDGFLILVRRGLPLFLFRFALIYMGSSRHRFEESGTVIEPAIDREEAKSQAHKNIAALIENRHLAPVHLSDPVQIRSAVFLTTAMEQFVIGHELGHAWTAIHDRIASLPAEADLDDGTTFAKTGQHEEFIADAWGAALCQGWAESVSAGNDHPAVRSFLGVLAPFLALSVIEAIERTVRSMDHSFGDTHPPANARKASLLQFQLARRMPETYRRSIELACDNAVDLLV